MIFQNYITFSKYEEILKGSNCSKIRYIDLLIYYLILSLLKVSFKLLWKSWSSLPVSVHIDIIQNCWLCYDKIIYLLRFLQDSFHILSFQSWIAFHKLTRKLFSSPSIWFKIIQIPGKPLQTLFTYLSVSLKSSSCKRNLWFSGITFKVDEISSIINWAENAFT